MSDTGHPDIIETDKPLSAIALFLAFTAAFSAVAYYFVIEMGLTRYYLTLLMLAPAFAVFLVCKIKSIPVSSLGWSWGTGRWQLLGYGIPLMYGLMAYGIIWGFGYGGLVDGSFAKELKGFLKLSGWSNDAIIPFGIFMLATLGLVQNVPVALGEEIGWRGFLSPLLMRKFNFATTSLITGIIWAIWHAPIIWLTKYNAGPVDLHLQFLNYTVMCIGLSFILTYFRLKSGSIWPCAFLHAAHNIFLLNIMQSMTVNYKETWRYAGEFGIFVPIIVLIFGLYFWRLAHADGLKGPLEGQEG